MDNAYKRKKRWYSLLALLITLLHLIPFYILVTTSLKGIGDFSSKWLFPSTLHFENFRMAWTDAQLGQSFLNTVIITFSSAALLIIFGSLAADRKSVV